MTQGVESRLTVIRSLCGSQCASSAGGGRKRIVAPDGSEIVPPSKPQPDGTLGKASRVRTAGSGCWRAMSTGGLAELSAAERISRSYICRVLRLTLLAPDIIDRVMDGGPTAGPAQF
jgi:hypothetical protein